jgi:hypothetical protein
MTTFEEIALKLVELETLKAKRKEQLGAIKITRAAIARLDEWVRVRSVLVKGYRHSKNLPRSS